MDVDSFFASYPDSRPIFDLVYTAACSLGPVQLQVSKSQVALASNAPFAWCWVPGQYLRRRAAPLVLTFSFKERRSWQRWKEIYEARRGRFTHHLELWSPEEVDDEVRDWLRMAREASTTVTS